MPTRARRGIASQLAAMKISTAAANSAAAIMASTVPKEIAGPEFRSTSSESDRAVSPSIRPSSRQRSISRLTLLAYEAIGHSLAPWRAAGHPRHKAGKL